KGFVYPNSEIYGGYGGFFDYGHLGVELKNNIKQHWWKIFVQQREDVVGIDGSIISNPKVWEASGHTAGFSDYIYTCDKCKTFSKGDDDKGIKCAKCGNELKNPSKFNLMFSTQVGPVADESNTAYLRPETAQQMFTNFKLVADNARLKLPFGIAQIGRAFRNEISPRDFLFRSREFEQMEIEYFVDPNKLANCPQINEVENLKVNILTEEMQVNNKEHEETTIKEIINKKLATPWHAYWLAESYNWFLELGIRKENLRLREHLKEELAHYAKACFDIEYKFPFGWKEIHGSADRQQFDLQQHIKFSKTELSLFDEETKQKIVPYVAAEPSQGVDRAFLAFLIDAYNYDNERGNIVLKLHHKLAPIKVGVFPLVNKLENEAKEIFDELKKEVTAIFDRSGSIGRRYARADEIGIPYCITVDFDSLKNKDVTIRDLLTTKQVRVKINDLKGIIRGLIESEVKFEELLKQ
ncbi:glycine--tRNA ligase, partial [Candidatus Woesearchaeota archaeon]|nr:glycine--tRNA ligase [Candidatus Woesearchaeota archaeon]